MLSSNTYSQKFIHKNIISTGNGLSFEINIKNPLLLNDLLLCNPDVQQDPTLVLDLINKGCIVNARSPDCGYTPLHIIAKYSSDSKTIIPIISALIKAGADVNAVDDLGDTPLAKAYKHENTDACNILLEHTSRKNPINFQHTLLDAPRDTSKGINPVTNDNMFYDTQPVSNTDIFKEELVQINIELGSLSQNKVPELNTMIDHITTIWASVSSCRNYVSTNRTLFFKNFS